MGDREREPTPVKGGNNSAEEISAQMDDASVNAHLDGDSIHVKVTWTQPAPVLLVEDGDACARVSLRLSESLKAQVQVAAVARCSP